jgi:hypothetical protein
LVGVLTADGGQRAASKRLEMRVTSIMDPRDFDILLREPALAAVVDKKGNVVQRSAIDSPTDRFPPRRESPDSAPIQD